MWKNTQHSWFAVLLLSPVPVQILACVPMLCPFFSSQLLRSADLRGACLGPEHTCVCIFPNLPFSFSLTPGGPVISWSKSNQLNGCKILQLPVMTLLYQPHSCCGVSVSPPRDGEARRDVQHCTPLAKMMWEASGEFSWHDWTKLWVACSSADGSVASVVGLG